MSDIRIRVEGLGKQYRLGARETSHKTLRDAIYSAGRRLCQEGLKRTQETFWALKNISFEVKAGDVLGVIGGNGAGKSTLLKILSRITEPTDGIAEIHGRLGSLLEVGTGFHPELTGRENIYLAGAILGMPRKEIDQRFDEIVAFSEIERFLDTPAKRYSSGMYMRLGFAVAAHLEPDVLLVDEVLAVGDANFQKKCLGRMETLAGTGRTVLFVSHNMSAIRALCNRVIVLERGEVLADTTDVSRAISKYANVGDGSASWTRPDEEKPRESKLVFNRLQLALSGDQPNHHLSIQVELASNASHLPAFIAFDITDVSLTPVMQALPSATPFIHANTTAISLRVDIDLPPLIPGIYRVSSWIGPHYTETYDAVPPVLEFQIKSSPDVQRSFPHSSNHGFVVPRSTTTACSLV